MIISTKIANLFKHCGFINVDYLAQQKISVPPCAILSTLEKEWRKWKKPLCMLRKTMFDGAGADPTFGYTSVGGDSLNVYGWAMATNRSEITEGSGTAESVSIYTASSDWHVRVAIYDDNAGNPNNLLWESPSTLGASGDWVTISTSSVTITQGEYYWLGLQHDVNGGMVKGDYVEPGYSKYREQSYGAFPDPFGTPDGDQPYKYSIYCTYTTTAVGQPYISRVQNITGMRTWGGISSICKRKLTFPKLTPKIF